MIKDRIYLPIGTNIKNTKNNTTYEIINVLGTGGSGITYKCKSSDGNYYCLKESYPSELAEFLIRENESIILNPLFKNDDIEERFQWYKNNQKNEVAKTSIASVKNESQNNDPRFLKSYGTFTSDKGNFYAVFDTTDGFSLSGIKKENDEFVIHDTSKLNSKKTLTFSDIVLIMRSLCTKLAVIHKNSKMLHLDISPANIYVIKHDNGYEGYYLDFGSAKEMSLSDAEHQYSASEYSAPEIIAKAQSNQSSIYKVGSYSDIYSLTAVFFKLVVGETFNADYRINPNLWKEKIKNLSLPGAVESKLIDIFSKGLSEKRTRFQTAEDMLVELCELEKLNGGKSLNATELINSITCKLNEFELNVNEKIENQARKTRKFSGVFAACATFVIISTLLLVNFVDIKPPLVQLIGAKITAEEQIEILGNSYELCFYFTDNSGIKYQDIKKSDISFDGLDCTYSIKKFNSGSFKLSIDINDVAENPQLIIKENCAEDNKGNRSQTIVYNIKWIPDDNSVYNYKDTTIPTVTLTPLKNVNGDEKIKNGDTVRFELYLDDETSVSSYFIKSEHIQTNGFTYESANIVSETIGKYTITLNNITCSEKSGYIYIAPGVAVDHYDNHTKGVKSREILFEN